ncbi:hypothetical protein GCM10012287_28790 [Streptomyces daqingensis]|uniref:Integral membrane protein n=1 Tax=Streptomyces daqingensis TaxID=1472640 RepID=A0ABQ2ME13_9ACTN|nr:hypothetical protein [Streptomyces daqingensis]GGO50033.1 hypothetical protein GCM10012287_28790 [Streptomyces daqingensis]
MHRHRGLCERAVDPLEIAAGLEAAGVTDRTAARFRHRDVFSLAEELFARVPRVEGEPDALSGRSGTGTRGRVRGSGNRAYRCARGRTARRLLNAGLVLLPALLTAACVALLAPARVQHVDGFAVAAGVAAAVLAVGASVRLALRRLVGAKAGVPTLLSAGWLTGVVVWGDRLPGGQGGAPVVGEWSAVTVAFALACALVPAVLCARRFAAGARKRLAASRTLDDFAAGMWPLLTATVALFAALTLGLQILCAEVSGAAAGLAGADPGGATVGASVTAEVLASTTALGMLLFTALLLTAHGFRRAASTGLGIACGAEAAALVASAVPGAGRLLGPLHPELVPAAVCACVALGLLAWAYRLLSGAFAHHGAAPRELRSAGSPPGRCAHCAPADGPGVRAESACPGDSHCPHRDHCYHVAHSPSVGHSTTAGHSSRADDSDCDEHNDCGETRAHSETPWGTTP